MRRFPIWCLFFAALLLCSCGEKEGQSLPSLYQKQPAPPAPPPGGIQPPQPEPEPPPKPPYHSIEAGDSFVDILQPSSKTLSYYFPGVSAAGKTNFYLVDIPAAGRFTVALSAGAMDMGIDLFPGAAIQGRSEVAQPFATDDSGWFDTQPMLTRDLTPGKYLIAAHAAHAETGLFQVRTSFRPDGAVTPLAAQPLPLDVETFGELDDFDPLWVDLVPEATHGLFQHLDLYEVELPQAGTLRVLMQSTQVDSYLYLFPESFLSSPGNGSNWIKRDDDSLRVNSGAAFDTAVLPAGRYVVVATSLGPGPNPPQTGAYRLLPLFYPVAAP